jgi:hypothetical protein
VSQVRRLLPGARLSGRPVSSEEPAWSGPRQQSQSAHPAGFGVICSEDGTVGHVMALSHRSKAALPDRGWVHGEDEDAQQGRQGGLRIRFHVVCWEKHNGIPDDHPANHQRPAVRLACMPVIRQVMGITAT